MNTSKIALFLSGERGIHVLRKLLDEGLNIKIVVMPTGIGQNFLEEVNLLKAIGKFDSIICANPNKLEILKCLELLGLDIFIVAGYPIIFKKELLAIPKLGSLNLHAGPLPKYRGGSPLNWQIINAEKVLGISIILLEGQIDNGPVVIEASLAAAEKISIADAHEWANSKFPEMTLKAIDLILSKERKYFRIQNEDEAVYWHQRNDGDGMISFARSTVKQIDSMVRALGRPYKGAWSIYGNEIVRIYEVQIPNLLIKGTPGRICFIQSKGPYVVCKDGALLLLNYEVPHGIEIKHGLRFD